MVGLLISNKVAENNYYIVMCELGGCMELVLFFLNTIVSY